MAKNKKQNKQKKKKRSKLFILLGIVLILAAVIILYYAFSEELPYLRAEKVYTELTDDNTNQPDDPMDRIIDWDSLRKMNGDIVGWIYILGTQVDYPICQSEDINYYLKHNAKKQYNILGAIFLPPEASPDFTDMNTVVYGHNMRSGQMFGELSDYQSEAFKNEHVNVYVYTPEKTSRYEVFNAFPCKSSSNAYTIGFEKGSEVFDEWISKMMDHCLYNEVERPSAENEILTLSTCADSGEYSSRYVVQCTKKQEKLIQKMTIKEAE